MKGIIYKYTSPSGKCYIGQTMNEARRKQEFLGCSNYAGNKIDIARKKYGPSNFSYEILYEAEDDNMQTLMEELNYMETYYSWFKIFLFRQLRNPLYYLQLFVITRIIR